MTGTKMLLYADFLISIHRINNENLHTHTLNFLHPVLTPVSVSLHLEETREKEKLL
jgi:hypothetical protein